LIRKKLPTRNEIYKRIDFDKNLYPFCIVWTRIPVLSHFLPFIGHVGICTSDGVIHDFAGNKTISKNRMAFGNPFKYLIVPPKNEE